ncbi:DUF5666 domain-containing protein [Helicobacter sp. MIT 99-5507]|uniref:DUF5666 domain-containing protein n=1 Tax=Helicobacter sp. MIT 99-5507 TaxID=152489 RepID=UPI000E1F16BE|nr:DUF5666 domain-containing protein [Helicobacter sp. MIT 99-5507]RDU57859.1 hypothetical protein CQA42_02860 [Helicobacter sp. MIT 99-5507]
MNKILAMLFTIGFISGLQADGFEIKGIIGNIDNSAKIISVNNINVQVMPQTHIKLDDCGIFGMDIDGKFSDLAVGSFVEVEAWPNSAVNSGTGASYIASEIEQKCVSNRAY